MAALRPMSDADAGAAFKAVLVYMTGGEVPVLPAAAHCVFESMRCLIDLSRKRSQAGKAGSGVGGQDTRFAPNKRGFVPGKQEEGPQSPDGFDVLSGLDAFLQ